MKKHTRPSKRPDNTRDKLPRSGFARAVAPFFDGGTEIGDAHVLRIIDAAEREADGLLAVHGALFGFGGPGDSDVFASAVGRVVSRTDPDIPRQIDALSALLITHQPSQSVLPDGVEHDVPFAHARAGYFLGLAIGRRLGAGAFRP